MVSNKVIAEAMTIRLDRVFKELPTMPRFAEGIRRAPKRTFTLSTNETVLALKNALRYVPEEWHHELAPEFLSELRTVGRIFGYRFRPAGAIKALPIDAYAGQCVAGRAFQVMIDNNLDFDVALFPYELVTYGDMGQVCQNWMQYRLIKMYLQEMTREQTLVVESGHPVGLFRSHAGGPRVVITNALMVGCYNDRENWHRAAAIGVANHGQTTAGGWMYIGPQGLIHRSYCTILNAARLKLKLPKDADLTGRLFVSSGLGAMGGTQGKAVEIANGIAVIAEVDFERIQARHKQGWVKMVAKTPEEAFRIAREYRRKRQGMSVAFHGNILDLLNFAVEKGDEIDLLSDQTSCHAAYEGGYCPQGLTPEEGAGLLAEEPESFRGYVDRSLRQHFSFIKILVRRGAYFFEYGNSFMQAVYEAGKKEICRNGRDPLDGFIFPSYVEDVIGPLLFDFGYGPLRWVCLSGKPEDLAKTDIAAMRSIDPARNVHDRDNHAWLRDAANNKLTVGGIQARSIFQDAEGRTRIGLRLNEMVRKGEIGPVMLGRDHHDTGATDSPFRETANIKDGSNIMADMAVQCFVGNAARGMSLVVLNNGGGAGIGKAINGGFGLVLDGSEEVDEVIRRAISWDVMGGVARRAWARNENSIETSMRHNDLNRGSDHITLPYLADDEMLRELVGTVFTDGRP